MSEHTIGIIAVVVLIFLLFSRIPIGFVLALIGFLGYSYTVDLKGGLGLLKTVPYVTGSFYSFTVIPLFLLMGEFAGASGQTENLYRGIYKTVGSLPGGLAISTIMACAAFGAVSGSSIATAAMMGTVSLPEMKKYGYSDELATGAVAAGGTLAILIPPSLALMIYGILTGESIGKLFLAGFLPGVVFAAILSAYIYVRCRLQPKMGPAGPRSNVREIIRSLRDVSGTGGLFFLVMGGIWLGVFTPTEAGAIGALGAFFYFLISGRFERSKFIAALRTTVSTTAMIFLIMIGATLFSYFLSVTKLPIDMANFILKLGYHPYIILVVLCICYLFLGCILDTLGILILTVPIVYPLIQRLGFDTLWFGVVLVVLLEIGLITPPVGLNVYVIAGVSKNPIEVIFRGIFPFYFVCLFFLTILILFPSLALWLPSTTN